ncbi:MAG: hypothetical protein OXE82_08085, partial [Rhodobacter sp.]|nr:hypothetical protein [Rhodobacter sp.]
MSTNWLSDIADIVMGQSPPGHTCNHSGSGMPLLNGDYIPSKKGAASAGRGGRRIQRHVRADRRAGGRLWRHPRRRGKRPNRKGGAHAGRGHIPGRVDIPERPAV